MASDTSTKSAEEVAKFHDLSARLYADSPEDSGRRALHHTSAALIRALAAERDALRAALQHYADDDYNGFNADGAHARAALKGKGDE